MGEVIHLVRPKRRAAGPPSFGVGHHVEPGIAPRCDGPKDRLSVEAVAGALRWEVGDPSDANRYREVYVSLANARLLAAALPGLIEVAETMEPDNG